jgi:hypothetical protein
VRTVDQAAMPPHRCAVFPQLGNSNARGFFDTGSDLDRQRVYVSFVAVCEMARELGWIGPTQRRGLEDEIASLKAEMEQVSADLEEAERQIAAIDFLGSKDFVTRQKKGPKKKETPTAKAA